jgi:3-phosphoshikimate 1-carboxyvinyltransferase
LAKILNGELTLPGDKSISHRALMMLSIAKGEGRITNLSSGQDVRSTFTCLQTMGCEIYPQGENVYRVVGPARLRSPEKPLDCGNSGTTIRLLSGLFAGTGVTVELTGDESLQKRPMKRIITPLTQMGARIQALGENEAAPIRIDSAPKGLHGISYQMPMASAQVKSAIFLAGLFASREELIQVSEPVPSRDHTERMLAALGVEIVRDGAYMTLKGRQPDLVSQDLLVPGDVSSAAFWLVGAAILPGSNVCLRQVGLNPHRTGLLNVLAAAGAQVRIDNTAESGGEPYGDLSLDGQSLKGDITIRPEHVPGLIDEIPILTVLGLFTDGVFTLHGAEELRYKESDRLGSLIELLRQLGIDVEAYEDGFSFQGNPNWQIPHLETPLKTYHDHRLVMALEILNVRASRPLPIEGKAWAAISYPTFAETLDRLLSAGSKVSG